MTVASHGTAAESPGPLQREAVLGPRPERGVGRVLFSLAFRRAVGYGSGSTPSFFGGVRMTTAEHQLECLGWRATDEGQRADGRYFVLAKSCDQFVIAFADTSHAAWSAACSMALKLTREGLRLPRPSCDYLPTGRSRW